MARVRTSAGMSPGLRLPSSECTSTPSQTSIATLARYSCERCIGLRVWNAATRDQPRRSNSARVSAGVMNSAPYFALKPPSESTCTGPARLTSPCCSTIFTPGCPASTVRNTDLHSCALSIAYFSVTRMVASTAPSSGSASAMSAPARIEPAVAASTDRVIGIGQNKPLAVRQSSHTPCQSARVMNPSSGVKPPMPSMMRSPFSRELTRSAGSERERARSAASASPAGIRGLSEPPPWGGTRPGMSTPPGMPPFSTSGCALGNRVVLIRR